MSQRDELLSHLATSLVDELILDIATEEHLVGLRRRTPCELCGGNCNAGACPPSSLHAPVASGSGTRATSPGPSNGKADVAFYDCLVCRRSIGSNRYAQHLSNCMGFSGRSRGTKRAAALSSNNGYSSPAHNGAYKSPYVTSDEDDDTFMPKKKEKNGIKRAASPLPSSRPTKKLNGNPSGPAPASLAPAIAPTVKPLPASRPSPFNQAARNAMPIPGLKVPSDGSPPTKPPASNGSHLRPGSPSSAEESDGSSGSDSPQRARPAAKPRPQVVINSVSQPSIARKGLASMPAAPAAQDDSSSGDA